MRFLFLSVMLLATNASAQTKDYSADVKSIDSIIAALYDVISGDLGASRDWDRFNNLFTSDARLIPTFKNKEGAISYRVLAPSSYSESFDKNMKTGFFEREVSRLTEQFGNIVHVFSTYETREQKDGPVTMRGINSIQLLKTADRYYVMQIFWSSENKENPLPEKYLKEN